MNQQSNAATSAVSAGSEHELFVLTDEQILEIVDGGPGVPPPRVTLSEPAAAGEAKNVSSGVALDDTVAANAKNSVAEVSETSTQKGASPLAKHAAEPPKWLADMMADPQAGAEARDLWTGIQHARQEAAAFREVFAKPEEARAAAERARALEEIDAAFYGGAGNSPEEASAARAVLAQRLMREDPAAFREMVLAGLRALQEGGANAAAHPHRAARPVRVSPSQPEQQTSQDSSLRLPTADRLGMTEASELAPQAAAHDVQVAAYRSFERAANADLERSVGSAIERTLAQAIPNISKTGAPGRAGAQHGAPLQARLQAAIHEDIEAALRADRQLGEQVAQVLASRRFDEDARTQVVRLINDRAQQLVPAATKRVINDWTQATLAAHGAKTRTAENSGTRADLTSGEPSAPSRRFPPGQTRQASAPVDAAPGRGNADATGAARLDYRKLSDEQILDL